MKPVRLLLISLGVLVLLAGITVALALTPSVQRWAVLRAARDVPGLKLEVAAVSGGFSGVSLRGVKAEHQHVLVSVDRLDADFSLFKVVFGKELIIGRLAVTGLDVDASRLSAAKTQAVAAGAPAAAPGLLAQVELPVDLKLDDVRIEGRARLPGQAGKPPLETDFTITGGKFAAGQEGLLQLTATVRNPAADAKVSALRTQAGLRATLTPQRTFSKVSLSGLIDAEGAGLTGQSELKVGVEMFQTSTGENYEVSVSTLLQGVRENLLNLHAQLPVGSRQYAGDWELKARTAQLEPFSLGGLLPEFDAKGGGRFAFDPGQENFTLRGNLQGRVSRLEAIDPAWRIFGTLSVDTDFDLSQQDQFLSLNTFKVAIAGDKPVLEANSVVPLRFDLNKHRLLQESVGTDRLLHVSLLGLPVAWVRPFVPGLDVSGSLITGQLDLVRTLDPQTDASVRGKLQAADIAVVQDGRPLLQRATVALLLEATLGSGALEVPVLNLTVTTPDGDSLDLQSKVSSPEGADAPLSVSGRFTASTAQLLARWLPGAPVKAEGDFIFKLQGQVIDIQPGRLAITQEAGRPLLSLTLKQGFALNLVNHEVKARNPAEAIARIELGRLPLSLLPITQPDTTLGGALTQGDFEVTAPAGKIVLTAVTPLRLSDVALLEKKRPQLSGLVIETMPVIEYAGPTSLKIQTGEVVVRNAAKQTLMTLKGDIIQSTGTEMQAALAFTLEIPALSGQPLFAGARGVSAGRASGEVRAATGVHTQLEARLTLNGLISAESGQTMPVANLNFRGLVQPNGAVSIQAPLLIDNAGNRSDLNFALELSPLAHGYSVDGRLTGQHVDLLDFLGVVGVFSASAVPDSPQPTLKPANVTPDTVSSWSNFSGQLGLDIKSVTRGKDWTMSGLTGRVAIEPTRLALSKLEAVFSETSRLDAKMELRFTGGAMPYRMTGEYSLSEFDAGKLFKALDPSKPPTVEGLFTLSAKLAGNGETTSRALERMEGEILMTSRRGIFRGLARATGKVSMATKTVDAVGALASIFGSDKIKQTAEKVAGQTYYVDQLAQSIGEFNYDLLSVRLVRDERLNMTLQDISLVSQEIRLTGRGDITYVADKPLLKQPLNVTMAFAARGKIEQILGKLRLLDGTKDELGYSRTKDAVTLGGTLEKPDPTGFFTKIASAKLSEYLDSEN